MTERLYYTDAYTTRFTARIVERVPVENQPAVVLDSSYFYPASGGQPSDRGWLNRVPVVEVFERPEDQAVVQVLAEPIHGAEVQAEIDWSRRFDHMQQHTGQHILSRSFVAVARASTIGFHLGEDRVTIDLNRSDLSPAQIEQAETLANDIIFANRAVTIRFTSDEAPTGRFAEKLAARAGPLRLVEIVDFDVQPCGGTHVYWTGEVGLVKILRVDRQGPQARVEFVCGRRALRDYRWKNALLAQVASRLSIGATELDQAVDRMQTEIKSLWHERKQFLERLQALEAMELLASAENLGSFRLIQQVFDRPLADVRNLAKRLVTHPGLVVLFGIPGSRAQLVFARSKDVNSDMVALVRQSVLVLGGQSGGGQADFAQAGGPNADEGRVRSALTTARDWLWAQQNQGIPSP